MQAMVEAVSRQTTEMASRLQKHKLDITQEVQNRLFMRRLSDVQRCLASQWRSKSQMSNLTEG